MTWILVMLTMMPFRPCNTDSCPPEYRRVELARFDTREECARHTIQPTGSLEVVCEPDVSNLPEVSRPAW